MTEPELQSVGAKSLTQLLEALNLPHDSDVVADTLGARQMRADTLYF